MFGPLKKTQRATAMAESNDSVAIDMEKIYLGGKVGFFIFFSFFTATFLFCLVSFRQMKFNFSHF